MTHAMYRVTYDRKADGQTTRNSTRLWAKVGEARKDFHIIAQAWYGKITVVSIRREG